MRTSPVIKGTEIGSGAKTAGLASGDTGHPGRALGCPPLLAAGRQSKIVVSDLPLFRRLPTWDIAPLRLVSQYTAVRQYPWTYTLIVTHLVTPPMAITCAAVGGTTRHHGRRPSHDRGVTAGSGTPGNARPGESKTNDISSTACLQRGGAAAPYRRSASVSSADMNPAHITPSTM